MWGCQMSEIQPLIFPGKAGKNHCPKIWSDAAHQLDGSGVQTFIFRATGPLTIV